jgi:hypothetical protein
LEIGLFDQFFNTSFQTYSHLASPSFCVQILGELEDLGLSLCPSITSTWTPEPLCSSDQPIMRLACKVFSKKGSAKINRCRMYLQLISIADLLTSSSGQIHPAYFAGQFPLGRVSTITWPSFPRPPRSYWGIWSYFLRTHVLPLISHSTLANEKIIHSRFRPTYYKHTKSWNLYRVDSDSLAMFKVKTGARSRYRVTHLNVPYDCDISFNHIDFYPVDVHCRDCGISVISGWNTPSLLEVAMPSPSLQQSFMSLPPALRETVGNVHFPPDNGVALLSKIKNKSIGIFDASDASLKDDQASHAWIFSSGDIDDISNPMLHVMGSGPVHGYPPYLSLTRGELQGITALAIVTKLFMDFHSFHSPVSVICDNKGVVSKCSTIQCHSLRKQHDVNCDLNLSFHDPSVSQPLALSWVRSHSDKQPLETIQDLKSQWLSRDETYNVWCDRMAQLEWSNGAVSDFDRGTAI